jgi:hypothetical protein
VPPALGVLKDDVSQQIAGGAPVVDNLVMELPDGQTPGVRLTKAPLPRATPRHNSGGRPTGDGRPERHRVVCHGQAAPVSSPADSRSNPEL